MTLLYPNPCYNEERYKVEVYIVKKWFYHRVMHSTDADGMANNVDPHQAAVWSESKLFA